MAVSKAIAPVGIKLSALQTKADTLPEEELVDFVAEAHQRLEQLWDLQIASAPGI